MTIDINEFADINISVSPTGASSGNFGILGFMTEDTDLAIAGKEILPAERSRAYSGIASVGADWETDSEVYKAATSYYSQSPSPTDFVVLVNYRSDTVASLVGGGSDSPEELAAAIQGDGAIDMTIDGDVVAVADLDLTSGTDEDSIAGIVESALVAGGAPAGTTCVWNNYQYVISGVATGSVSATITFSDDSEAARALGLTQASAKISNGIDAETANDALSAVLVSGREFVALVTHKMFRDLSTGVTGDLPETLAATCEAAKKIFMNTTNDRTHLVTGSSNIGSRLMAKSFRFTLSSFASDVNQYPSASVFGRAASVNFSAVASTITLNLKQMPGITSENLSPAEFEALRGYRVSAVVRIGKTVNAYTDSRMANGSFLDTTHGLMWFENRGEVDMFNLLYTTATKIPYTQEGINTAAATLERSCQAAVRNGLAGPGYLPDGTYLPDGFLVSAVALADTPASDKSNRVYNGLSFVMVGAGALHGVTVSGQFSE